MHRDWGKGLKMGNKGKLAISLAFIVVSMVASKVVGETVAVENSRSPDGKLSLRLRGQQDGVQLDQAWYSKIEIVKESDGKVLAVFDYPGSVKYPYNAKPENLGVLWSPSSEQIALMVRTTKRSWQTLVVALDGNKLKPTTLPSGIKRALNVLGVKKGYRVVRERPTKWIDENTLVVQVTGDAMIGGKVRYYHVDLVYEMSKNAI